MSEAELHLLAGRLQGAKRAAAERGELRTPLPVGYLYDDDGICVLDPDEEVAAAVADVFTAFTATGSAYGVVAAFSGRRFPRRAYGGAWAGQVRFDRLTHSRTCAILSNPAYAGAYVFGRYRSRRTVTPDGTIRTATVQLLRSEWAVCIREHHPGYIDWDTFLTNEAKLAANRTNAGARPPREGTALCQGIVICGSCGRPMSTRYAGGNPYYECARPAPTTSPPPTAARCAPPRSTRRSPARCWAPWPPTSSPSTPRPARCRRPAPSRRPPPERRPERPRTPSSLPARRPRGGPGPRPAATNDPDDPAARPAPCRRPRAGPASASPPPRVGPATAE